MHQRHKLCDFFDFVLNFYNVFFHFFIGGKTARGLSQISQEFRVRSYAVFYYRARCTASQIFDNRDFFSVDFREERLNSASQRTVAPVTRALADEHGVTAVAVCRYDCEAGLGFIEFLLTGEKPHSVAVTAFAAPLVTKLAAVVASQRCTSLKVFSCFIQILIHIIT